MKYSATLCLLCCFVVHGKPGLLETDNILNVVRGTKVSVNLNPLLLVNGETATETTSMETVTSRFSPISPPTRKLNSCGIKYVNHVELIRNGSPTKRGEWPWHVALYRYKTQGTQQQYICGGSLINQYTVITVAHCVVENQGIILSDRLIAVTGKHRLLDAEEESQRISVYNIIVHPSFSRSVLTDDIAILKLSTSVKFSDYVQPICLWNDAISDIDKKKLFNKIGTVVGWGYTADNALASESMMSRLPVISDLDCIKSNPLFYSRFITDRSFCAGIKNGTGVCNGDSGGGMYFSRVYNNQEIWYLRGLVSLTVSEKDKNVCDPNEYTIFTDVAQFNEFIQGNL